jgi:hypothetical protein
VEVVDCEHVPPEHVYRVTERDCEPEPPHASASQPLQEPVLGVPQLFPLVVRLHDCVSVLVLATHWPVAQLYAELVTVRVCVPVCAHASLKLHALHAP